MLTAAHSLLDAGGTDLVWKKRGGVTKTSKDPQWGCTWPECSWAECSWATLKCSSVFWITEALNYFLWLEGTEKRSHYRNSYQAVLIVSGFRFKSFPTCSLISFPTCSLISACQTSRLQYNWRSSWPSKYHCAGTKSHSEGYFEGLPSFVWSDVKDKDKIGKEVLGQSWKGITIIHDNATCTDFNLLLTYSFLFFITTKEKYCTI